MSLGDITGVLSRYFVVGFFLPAYVSLVALWITASSAFIPNSLARYGETTQLLILAGVALVGGLTLSGFSYYITRIFEGYPLERFSAWPVINWGYRAAISLQRRTFDRYRDIRDDKAKPPKDRASAAWTLDRFFPHDRDGLLPTRIGNAMRAFERHSNVRWGLDGITIWPRIEALMSAEERELHVDAKINLYVFINSAVGAIAVGVCLIVDTSLNSPKTGLSSWVFDLIPFVLAYLLYRAAVGPAAEWGDSVRASIDLHRLEIYEKLGVRSPTSFSDERALADRLNKALLYGHPLLPDDLWRDASPEHKGAALAPNRSLSLWRWLSGGGVGS